MVDEKKIMVFGYVRVSTDNQLENYSIDEQIQRITAYCRAKGWVLLKIYTDGGFSGGNTNRPALQQMLAAISKNQVSAVVVYKLDRLSRSQKDTLILIEDAFLSHSVDFVSINENFDTSSPFGRAMIGILSVFAQLEKDQITERFMMGRIGRSKAGYFHGGGFNPLGYNYIDGNLVVDEYKAMQVREIFDMFLKGKSINAIWHEMEDKYGGKWSSSKISVILSNSIYIGKIKFAKIEHDGLHQSIISKEVFEMANKFLISEERENSKTAPQKTPFRAEYLLSSLIICANCGARYSANHGFYKCYSRSKSSRNFIKDPNCKNTNWVIADLDTSVINNIRGLLDSSNFFEKALADTQLPNDKINKKAIEKQIKNADIQIDRLIDLYQVGSVPMETLAERINEMSREKAILQSQLLENDNDLPARKKAFMENAKRFSNEFDTADLEARRLLISSLIEAVLIDKDNVSIKWRV